MGEKVDTIISQSICAFKNLDVSLSSKIVNEDKLINEKEHNIEKFCLNMIALQQPMASDLRNITACLKIITDIERIADHCADICEIIMSSKISSESTNMGRIISLLDCVQVMFKNVLNVFSSQNVDDAVNICSQDDEIDSLFSDIVLSICKAIAKNSLYVESEVDLLFIAKYAERIADHCTNIAEWVIYMKTGQHPELN